VDYRWNYAPVGLAPALDWEQQERTQVAPGAVPTSPTILPGSCQPGTSDCPPANYYIPVGPPPPNDPPEGPR
jgi:hypothetical protein